ncbi:MAG: PH domain-containing protein [Acidimicrobiales bacterium]
MAFSEDQLYSNEEVVLDLKPHWWFFASQAAALFWALVLGILAGVVIQQPVVTIVALGLIVVILFWFVARYVIWTTTSFVVTTDRLINRSGVFSRQGTEIPLERVNTVFFAQTFFERIIGSGDLEIESASEQGSQKFSNIRKPLNVQNEIYRQMEENENRKFDRVGRNLVAGAGVGDGGLSIPDQIEKLDLLRQKGIISDREFEDKKIELLDRM